MALQQLELKITGMTCGHCENFVKNVIGELDGISNLTVDHRAGKAGMAIDNAKVTPDHILKHVNETGVYHAEIITQ